MMITMRMMGLAFGLLLIGGCGGGTSAGGGEDSGERLSGGPAGVEAVEAAMAAIAARAQAMDEALRPLPLLRPREEAGLRRFPNRAQLEKARLLGVAPQAAAADLDGLVAAGRLIRLADTTAFWIVRDLDHSLPYVTPDVEAMLRELGRRFHARLAGLGIPLLRFEVSSALRTSATQEALRQENVNAARGRSTHEYGTTVDVAYSGYVAPEASPPASAASIEGAPPQWAALLGRVERLAVERVAARRSRELQAVMGQVLTEMQREGWVMVTLETQQPVYHLTVARRG